MVAKGGKVLIIDNEAGQRKKVIAALAKAGFAIEEAERGIEALLKIEKAVALGRPFEAVIADLYLPDINGLKLIEVIKSRRPNLPVILTSGYGGENLANETKSRGGDELLFKPFEAETLSRLLQTLPEFASKEGMEMSTVKTKRSVTAYCFIKIADKKNAGELFRRLYFLDNVLYCDAVKGVYDLALMVNGDTSEEIDEVIASQIKPMKEIGEIEFCPVVTPQVDEALSGFIKDYEKKRSFGGQDGKADDDKVSAYLLAEIEKDKFGAAFPQLYLLDCVVSCDAVKGKYDAVLLLKADNFKELERISSEEIRPIDGIVRTKFAKILKMFEE